MRLLAVAVAVAVTGSVAPVAAAPAHSCFGEPATIVGTPGKDKLNGTGRRDVIVTLGGNDRVHGGEGNDLICLGDGGDEEAGFGDRGRDRISGGRGDERIYGGRGGDLLALDAGGGRAVGGPGADELVGGPGRDFMGGDDSIGSGGSTSGGGYNYEFTFGEPGDDRISTGLGNDRIYLGPGDKTIDGGGGVDRLVHYSHERGDFLADLAKGLASGPGRSTLVRIEDVHAWTLGDIVVRGDDEANELLGTPSIDGGNAQLYGAGGNDLLVGQNDSNRRQQGDADLYGGFGDDVLVGQWIAQDQEIDELFGGPGDDVIDPVVGLRFVSGGPGADTLESVEDHDRSEVSYDGGTGFDLVAWPETSGVDADLEAGVAVVRIGETEHTYPLSGIEAVQGSEWGPDVLLGDEHANLLIGGTTDYTPVGLTPDGDRIEGRGGDDELHGYDGNDDLDGGDGEDVLHGGDGLDACRNGETAEDCET